MPVTDEGNSVLITIPGDESTNCRILKFGANVLSWNVKGRDHLWLSEKAILDGTKAVRGGIPLVFPVFGKNTDPAHPTSQLPQHGFARTSVWEFLGATDDQTAQFGLGPECLSAEAAKAWPYNFTLVYTVRLTAGTLETDLSVENTDTKPFEFNQLFHTYFKVQNIASVEVQGLQAVNVTDKIACTGYIKKPGPMSIHEETDRVYCDEPGTVTIEFEGKPYVTIERSSEIGDIVVWNPWNDKAQDLTDFYPKDAYKQMICVEAGSVGKFIKLSPGKKWRAKQVLKL